MKPRLHAATTIVVVIGIIGFFGTFIWTQRKQQNIQDAVVALNQKDVASLLVYDESWPRGEPRLVADREKIDSMMASLRSGNTYFPSHDQQNGFERFIILKPQNIALSVYQKGEENSVIIVKPGYWRSDKDYSTYGHLSCSPPDAWKSL